MSRVCASLLPFFSPHRLQRVRECSLSLCILGLPSLSLCLTSFSCVLFIIRFSFLSEISSFFYLSPFNSGPTIYLYWSGIFPIPVSQGQLRTQVSLSSPLTCSVTITGVPCPLLFAPSHTTEQRTLEVLTLDPWISSLAKGDLNQGLTCMPCLEQP